MSQPSVKLTKDQRITEGPVVRGVLYFGIPLVIAMTCHGTFNLVDAWFIGRLDDGGVALAAIALCDPVLMIATIFANGVSTASVAIISRARGASDHDRVRRLAGQSLILVALISLLLGGGGAIFARQIGQAMAAQGEVLELVTSYLQLNFSGIVTMIVLLQLTAILRAVGGSIGPTIVLVAANVLNIVVDPFLIDAEGLLGIEGLPKLGLMGAGYATVGARFVGCLVAFWLVWRAVPRLLPNRGEWSLQAETVKSIVRIGTPNSIQLIVRVTGLLILVRLAGVYFATDDNPAVVAAMGIGIRLDMVVLFGAMGWGAAAATFVGQNMGKGNHRRAAIATWASSIAGVSMMAIVGAAMFVFAEDITRFLAPESEATIAYATEYLRWVSPTYGMAAGAVVLALALNGAGSTRAPAAIDGVAYLLLVCPAALILIGWLGSDQTGIWAAIAGGNVVLMAMYSFWFARGSWRTIGV